MEGSARKRRRTLPSQRALAAARMLMPTWWAMVQRTFSPRLSAQRPGLKSRASRKPKRPRAPKRSSSRRLRTAPTGSTAKARKLE